MANLLPGLLKEQALEKSMSRMALEDRTQVVLIHKKNFDNGLKIKSKKCDTKQKSQKFKGACYCKSECRKLKSEMTSRETSTKVNNELLMVNTKEDDKVGL